MVEWSLEDGTYHPSSFFRYDRPVAVFSCHIFPYLVRDIVAQIVTCHILAPFQETVVQQPIKVISLMPSYLTHHRHGRQSQHAMLLVTPALLKLSGLTVDIVPNRAVILSVQVEILCPVIHFPVIRQDGCCHISLRHDQAPISVGTGRHGIKIVHCPLKMFLQHSHDVFNLGPRDSGVRMLQYFQGTGYLKSFQACQKHAVVRFWYSLQGRSISRKDIHRFTGIHPVVCQHPHQGILVGRTEIRTHPIRGVLVIRMVARNIRVRAVHFICLSYSGRRFQ